MLNSSIRILKTDDLEEIAALDASLFPGAPRLTTNELEGSEWWVATWNGENVGYAGIALIPSDSKAFLTRSGVSPTVRGAGLQKRFIRTRIRYAKKHGILRCYTYCGTYNLPSMRSLISCGLKPYYLSSCAIEGDFLYFENAPKIRR